MKGQWICTTCGYIGRPKKVTRGSFWMEVVLWMLLIVPGIIYSVWRLTSKQKVCPKCGKPTMIPLDTPMGQELLHKQQRLQQSEGR